MLTAMLAGLTLFMPHSNEAAKARQIFETCRTKLKSVKSIVGTLTGTQIGAVNKPLKTTFVVQKPNSYRVLGPDIELYSNGTFKWNYLVTQHEYFKTKVAHDARADNPFLYGLEPFFGYSMTDDLNYFVKSTQFRMGKIDGNPCAILAVHFESSDRDDNMVFYVDAHNALPLGWDQDFGGAKMAYRYKRLQFNKVFAPKTFDWTPPADVKERSIEAPPNVPR